MFIQRPQAILTGSHLDNLADFVRIVPVVQEESGDALSYAAKLISVERMRVALLGDEAEWIWKQLPIIFH